MEGGSEIKAEVNTGEGAEQTKAQETPDAEENENPLSGFFAPRTESEPVPEPVPSNGGPTTPDDALPQPPMPPGSAGWQSAPPEMNQGTGFGAPENQMYQEQNQSTPENPPGNDFSQGPPVMGFGGPPEMNEQPPMNQGMMGFGQMAGMNFSGGFMGQNQQFGGMQQHQQNQQFQQAPQGQYQDQHHQQQNYYGQNPNQQGGYDQEPPSKAPRLDPGMQNEQSGKPEAGKYDVRGLDDNCVFDKIIKMSGLPYRITRGEIRDFFKPLDLTDVRIEIGK